MKHILELPLKSRVIPLTTDLHLLPNGKQTLMQCILIPVLEEAAETIIYGTW